MFNTQIYRTHTIPMYRTAIESFVDMEVRLDRECPV